MRSGLFLIAGLALALLGVLVFQGAGDADAALEPEGGENAASVVRIGGSPLDPSATSAQGRTARNETPSVLDLPSGDREPPTDHDAARGGSIEPGHSIEIPDFFTQGQDPEITSPLPDAYELEDQEGPVVRMEFDDGTLWFEAFGARNADGDWTRDGLWNCWHSNGETHEQGAYRAGVEHGRWKWWYPDGNRMATGRFVDGLREGSWDFYFDTGDLAVQGNYLNDRGEGTWTLYYPGGARQAEGRFGEGGAQGLWTVWTKTGVIDRERTGMYVDGELQ